ncbi:MAG: hypothetical protein GQ559_07140 [Desulfobulbaceae bacterium]|nr:hypothetical protein [Desulfobulbaceae bacterium]
MVVLCCRLLLWRMAARKFRFRKGPGIVLKNIYLRNPTSGTSGKTLPWSLPRLLQIEKRMKINRLRVYRLAIPFSLAASHNLAERSESEASLVIAESDNGFTGVGEGTPRQYVTGETLPGCVDAALEMGRQLTDREWHDIGGLNRLLDHVSMHSRVQQNPSAWCAVELACLDLFARSRQIPLWQLFADTPVNLSFTYSAVIPLLNGHGLDTLLTAVKSLDMGFVKVKVSTLREGVKYVGDIREALGPDVDIRIDANGAFAPDDALEFEQAADFIGISSFEQPVAKENLEGFNQVTQQGKIPTIADESMCNKGEMENFIRKRGCAGFNIRLSKCGGFRESLNLWNHALQNGFFCQLGCHVGETGILSAAGRHFAALCSKISHLEGGYAGFVLESDICNEVVSFGRRGEAGLPKESGLGVTINEKALDRWGELMGELS